ncbi:MAG: NlpC/P60 family protein [Actinobacteria bacterium]|nr:NlpC/P60 family protein [Actinomycetota bacterium]
MLNARSIRLRPVVSLLALIVVALIAGFAPGAAHADRLANARAEADQAQADLQVLNDKVAVAAEAYNAAQQQLDETNAKIDENQQVLAATKSNLSVSRRELSTMLVDAYRQGNPDLIAFLLNANSIDSLIDQTRFIQRVTGHAEGVVRDVRRYTSDVKQREQALEEERGIRQSALQDRAAQEASVRETLAARTRLLNSLSTEIQGILAQREAAQRAADAARAAQAGGILADASAGAGNADLSIGGSVGGGADYSASIPAPPSSSTGGSAASVALGQLGTPYVWGGGAPGGFDCSGLIAWAYAQVGISLPHYAAAQYSMGTPVPMDALEPGDLISFHGSGHIGMYIGGGQYVHAPQTGDVVKVSTLADRSDADGAVRVG